MIFPETFDDLFMAEGRVCLSLESSIDEVELIVEFDCLLGCGAEGDE